MQCTWACLVCQYAALRSNYSPCDPVTLLYTTLPHPLYSQQITLVLLEIKSIYSIPRDSRLVDDAMFTPDLYIYKVQVARLGCQIWAKRRSDWPQIGQIRDLFSDQIFIIFWLGESESGLKSTGFVPFGANLTFFCHNFAISGQMS